MTEKCPKCGADHQITGADGRVTYNCKSYRMPRDGHFIISCECSERQFRATIATQAKRIAELEARVEELWAEQSTLQESANLQEKVVFGTECARDYLERTKGVTGSGTVACGLWHELNGLVSSVEAQLAKGEQ